jgi:allantoinase
MRRRPSSISVQPYSTAEAEEYLSYYSQYPEEAETLGVDALLAALRVIAPPPNCRIHVANVCSASAICSVLAFKSHFRGHLTVETAPHYLFYSYEKVENGNTRFKVCPPIRAAENQTFLWKLLRAEGLDAVSSNHSSIPLDYKFLHSGSFKRALSGISSLGFGLRALVTRSCADSIEIANREKDLAKFVMMMATRPACILGIEGKRGAIERRKYADLVVFAAFEEPQTSKAYGKYPETCPFARELLYGQVQKVIIRGKTAFSNGEFFPVGRKDTREAYI